MTDWLLGLIALGTLITALLQVVVVVALIRMVRRSLARAERVRAMIAPLSAHVGEISDSVSRAKSVADGYTQRLADLYHLIEPPFRKGATAFAVARGIAAVFRRSRRR